MEVNSDKILSGQQSNASESLTAELLSTVDDALKDIIGEKRPDTVPNETGLNLFGVREMTAVAELCGQAFREVVANAAARAKCEAKVRLLVDDELQRADVVNDPGEEEALTGENRLKQDRAALKKRTAIAENNPAILESVAMQNAIDPSLSIRELQNAANPKIPSEEILVAHMKMRLNGDPVPDEQFLEMYS